MGTALRRWDETDADALLAALRSDPELELQLGGLEPRLADCRRVLAEHLVPLTPEAANFAVSVDGLAVGNLGISHVEHRHDSGWVHYWLAAGYRGRGLASAGLVTLAGWAFAELDLFRLELGHRTNNSASCGVARAAGFAVDGLKRSKLRYGDLRFDVETHARLITDPAPAREPLPIIPS